MTKGVFALLDKLAEEHSLTVGEYKRLITSYSEEAAAYAAEAARLAREKIYGNKVYIRGLIEIGNYCKNDCLYCGIRRSNKACSRYRLSEEEILQCTSLGYELGFRTFVLQGGEDSHYSDEMLCRIISTVKARHPDCAVTLSLGERGRESFERLFRAGADRYLLRHETADPRHYGRLHPHGMTLKSRLSSLRDLKEIGYQVGCGFMVGSPYQTPGTLAKDLKFIEEFKPHMCGIGPFIPQSDTPFGTYPAGSVGLTCYLLSIIRLISPGILLPATTALGSLKEDGRELGILAGANVVMPNLSPPSVRKKYALYDNKLSSDSEAAEGKSRLAERLAAIGYEIAEGRGDSKI